MFVWYFIGIYLYFWYLTAVWLVLYENIKTTLGNLTFEDIWREGTYIDLINKAELSQKHMMFHTQLIHQQKV